MSEFQSEISSAHVPKRYRPPSKHVIELCGGRLQLALTEPIIGNKLGNNAMALLTMYLAWPQCHILTNAKSILYSLLLSLWCATMLQSAEAIRLQQEYCACSKFDVLVVDCWTPETEVFYGNNSYDDEFDTVMHSSQPDETVYYASDNTKAYSFTADFSDISNDASSNGGHSNNTIHAHGGLGTSIKDKKGSQELNVSTSMVPYDTIHCMYNYISL